MRELYSHHDDGQEEGEGGGDGAGGHPAHSPRTWADGGGGLGGARRGKREHGEVEELAHCEEEVGEGCGATGMKECWGNL